jgi:hypothetical protein
MVWRAAKGLLKDGRSDLSDQHWDRGGGGWPSVAEQREYCSRRGGSRERAIVSICVSGVNTSNGVVRRRPDLSSLRMEISVGSAELYFVPAEV